MTVLTTFASFADVRFSNNTSDHLEAILKTERQREITKVTTRGTTQQGLRPAEGKFKSFWLQMDNSPCLFHATLSICFANGILPNV